MTTPAHDVGDTRVLSAAFTVAGTPTDPTALSFVMRAPDGAETTYLWGTDDELVNDSTGNFHVDWPVAQAGRHHYRWIGTGAAAEADSGEFYALAKGTS